MNHRVKTLLLWTPRVLTVLFALFISLFALDVFEEGAGLWRTVAALSMHLIPTFVVLFFLVLAWQREWVGAITYVALGFLYLVVAWGRFHWSAYAAISGPLFLIGFMFFASWLYRVRSTRNQPKSGPR